MRPVRMADNLTTCAIVIKSGNLNFLELSEPVQACNGTAVPLYVLYYFHVSLTKSYSFLSLTTFQVLPLFVLTHSWTEAEDIFTSTAANEQHILARAVPHYILLFTYGPSTFPHILGFHRNVKF